MDQTKSTSSGNPGKSSAGKTSYADIGKRAVNGEIEVKKDAGPSVSMTVVGETVTFEQHFHF